LRDRERIVLRWRGVERTEAICKDVGCPTLVGSGAHEGGILGVGDGKEYLDWGGLEVARGSGGVRTDVEVGDKGTLRFPWEG